MHECQIYVEILREFPEKEVIRELRKALVGRVESQIRAHHMKMLKKYKTV